MAWQGVVAFVRGDVNGDHIPDNVYLTGFRASDVSIVQNIALVIQDGVTGTFYTKPLKENMGYNPSLFLGDFTGDNADDILISIATGGSGGTYYYYIYSFVGNISRMMFDSDVYNRQYTYDVTFKDNYRQVYFKHPGSSYFRFSGIERVHSSMGQIRCSKSV